MALMVFGVSVARAQETAVTQDVVVTFAESGEFSVTLEPKEGGEPTFGEVKVDAATDRDVSLTFILTYTDTRTYRDGTTVTLAVDPFEPIGSVPEPVEDVIYQIPNRYVTLSGVGEVTIDPASSCEAGTEGAIVPDESDVGLSFVDQDDQGIALTVATVTAGCGVGMATQEIGLTLTVPAGVYPTTYQAVVTVATTVDGE